MHVYKTTHILKLKTWLHLKTAVSSSSLLYGNKGKVPLVPSHDATFQKHCSHWVNNDYAKFYLEDSEWNTCSDAISFTHAPPLMWFYYNQGESSVQPPIHLHPYTNSDCPRPAGQSRQASGAPQRWASCKIQTCINWNHSSRNSVSK